MALREKSTEGEEVEGEKQLLPEPTGITLLYQTGWPTPRLHYSAEGADWTAVPGEAMAPSDWSTFPHADGWWSIQVPASALEFVMTDGHGNWAKDQNGRNLFITGSGTWTLRGNVITKLLLEDLRSENSCSTLEAEQSGRFQRLTQWHRAITCEALAGPEPSDAPPDPAGQDRRPV
ncbi:unnamed protein product, partial [Symbiodinium pilosum]